MTLKTPIGLAMTMLTFIVSIANAQTPAQLLDQIARSLPQIDAAWKHASTDSYRCDDGSTQASIKWRNGETERGATVIIHATLKRARQSFRPGGKEDLQEAFRIDGVGDEAFLWPPKSPAGGAYNVRFRRAHVEVWMSGGSESDVRRYASAIAAAIANASKRTRPAR